MIDHMLLLDTAVNYMTVLAAAVASMAVGLLWYSPLLFGKPWMKLMGLTDKKTCQRQKKRG